MDDALKKLDAHLRDNDCPSIIEGLAAYERGEGVSTDWLFEPGCDGKCDHDECICPVEDED